MKLSRAQIGFLNRAASRAAAIAIEECLRTCEACGSVFLPARESSRFCSQKCAVRIAVRNFRKRQGEENAEAD